ncbi:MAG: HAMP domain-containing histidine kinase [Lachnospiraceae bacterium]|nr:HAMP domain-containing histidine kinase [Lachnospiraceae bacterium]
MKASIRMKIFLPVTIILIAFTLAVWIMFRYTLDVHMNYNAKRDLELTIARVERVVNETYLASAAAKAIGAEEDTERILSLLQSEVQTEGTETRMLAVSGGYRVLHPVSFDDSPEMTEFYSLFLTKATGAEEFWEQGRILEETVGNGKYLLYYRHVENEDTDRVKHLILYTPIYDTSIILDQMSQFLLLIMIGIAAVTIILFWFVAGSISGPLIRLSEAARGIGEKRFKKVETGATVKELLQLEHEINQMQEKLEQADQAERTFFQNASHELRTPLMSISGYAQGIQCGVFEDTAQAAGIILDESTRLTEVVDGILTLTRMDQLRYQVVPVEMDIEHFVEERLERLEGFAFSQNKKLVFVPGSGHKMTVDAMLLERAFSNVVSNCIRYAKVQVTVAVEVHEAGVRIMIRDDGPGIPIGEIDRIFDRFHKGKNGNHGLGLAIAKASLEYMGGTIFAESSSEGAVFLMELPHDCRSFAPEEQVQK